MLEQQKIGIIQFEYGEFWSSSGSTLSACFQLLSSCQHEMFLLGKNSLLEFNYEIYGEYFRYGNFVAISKNKIDKYRYLIKGAA